MTDFDAEREANIARNKALLAQLDLSLDINSEQKQTKKPKPVPAQKRKRDDAPTFAVATRQSARLRRGALDPNEPPEKKRKREKEEEEKRRKEEEERLNEEEKAREARKPRHHVLPLSVMLGHDEEELSKTLIDATFTSYPRAIGTQDDFVYDDDEEKEEAEISKLREKMSNLKVVAMAKVTDDRVYSAAYHPIPTKDLVFFGDKHGALGIWDARATEPSSQTEDDNNNSPPPSSSPALALSSPSSIPSTAAKGKGSNKVGKPDPVENTPQGRVWQLQPHWPATSKSSISCIKFDPLNAHNVYTSSYDNTLRLTSLHPSSSSSSSSVASYEILYTPDTLLSAFDFAPHGNEMWVSDADGGISQVDLREPLSLLKRSDDSKQSYRASRRRWVVSAQKVGCVSVNPVSPWYVLTASNDRTAKVWDTRKLQEIAIPVAVLSNAPAAEEEAEEGLVEYDYEVMQTYLESKKSKGAVRGSWSAGKSMSSAYWDVRGRGVVGVSYDDTIRLWDVKPQFMRHAVDPFPTFRPTAQISHNCQTGKWLTIFKAQWSPNPNAYPHFTIGNLHHSLDIFTAKGGAPIARLKDSTRLTATQAVTCSHPSIVERAASGNASGRCVLWGPEGLFDE